MYKYVHIHCQQEDLLWPQFKLSKQCHSLLVVFHVNTCRYFNKNEFKPIHINIDQHIPKHRKMHKFPEKHQNLQWFTMVRHRTTMKNWPFKGTLSGPGPRWRPPCASPTAPSWWWTASRAAPCRRRRCCARRCRKGWSPASSQLGTVEVWDGTWGYHDVSCSSCPCCHVGDLNIHIYIYIFVYFFIYPILSPIYGIRGMVCPMLSMYNDDDDDDDDDNNSNNCFPLFSIVIHCSYVPVS